MLDDYSIAKMLGSNRAEGGAHRLESSVIYGTAVEDSDEGYVRVIPDGDVYSEDGDNSVVIASGPSVQAGDTVQISLLGGVSKTPMVTAVSGEGDRQNALIKAAKEAADAADAVADAASEAITQVQEDIAAFKDGSDVSYAIYNYVDEEIGEVSTEITATYSATAPNLAPFFSHSKSDVYDASTNPNGYWARVDNSSTSQITTYDMEVEHNGSGGWAHIAGNITSGSPYVRFEPKMPILKPSTVYTVLLELDFISVESTLTKLNWAVAGGPSASPADMWSASKSESIIASGTYRYKMTTATSTSDKTILMRGYMQRPSSGGTGAFEVYARLSLYEGDYKGDYKPYRPSSQEISQEYSTKSELSQTADDIELAVSQNYVSNTTYSTDQNALDTLLEGMQNQIDGQVEVWYKSVDPTTSNEPASTWTTEELRQRHNGDLYYNDLNGHAWRWVKENNAWQWNQIPDSDAAAALALAQAKRRVFTSTPTVPYDVGDLWVRTVDGAKQIWQCSTAKASTGSYSVSDWTLASTDDTALDSYKTTVQQTYATISSLTVGNNFITAEVSDNYAKKTYVNSAIDDLEIGGRNLLQGTADPVLVSSGADQPVWFPSSGGNGTVEIGTVADSPVCGITKSMRISNNTSGNRDWAQRVADLQNTWNGSSWDDVEWMFSSYVRGIGGSCEAQIRCWGNISNRAVTKTVGTDWEKLEIPITLYAAHTTAYEMILIGIKGAGSIEYIAPKLERGNKATEWTPAPEDKAESSLVAEHTTKINQTATSIESLAQGNTKYTAPDGTTKTNSITSLITQTASGIESSVAATYASKQESAMAGSVHGNGSVEVGSGAAQFKGLTIEGKAVQNGTPTPSTPVPIQVVGGANYINTNLAHLIADNTAGTWADNVYTYRGVSVTVNSDGTLYLQGTATGNFAFYLEYTNYGLVPGDYYLSGCPSGGSSSTYYMRVTTNNSSNTVVQRANDYGTGAAFTLTAAEVKQTCIIHLSTGDSFIDQVELKLTLNAGSAAIPYVPYGSLGIAVTHNGTTTVTPIDLQGNVLASLSDGTKDVLTVDSAGHVGIEKNTGNVTLDGSNDEGWSVGSGKAYGSSAVITGLFKPPASTSEAANALCNLCQALGSHTSQIGANEGVAFATGGTNIYLNLTGATATTTAALEASLAATPATLYYQLKNSSTIDLGTITLPAIADGDTVSIIAQVSPDFTLEWWMPNGLATAELTTQLAGAQTQIEQTAYDVSIRTELYDNLAKNFKFSANGMEITQDGSTMSSQFDSDALRFKSGDMVVMELDAQSSTARADRFAIGKYQWKSVDSGNAIALVYVGG